MSESEGEQGLNNEGPVPNRSGSVVAVPPEMPRVPSPPPRPPQVLRKEDSQAALRRRAAEEKAYKEHLRRRVRGEQQQHRRPDMPRPSIQEDRQVWKGIRLVEHVGLANYSPVQLRVLRGRIAGLRLKHPDGPQQQQPTPPPQPRPQPQPRLRRRRLRPPTADDGEKLYQKQVRELLGHLRKVKSKKEELRQRVQLLEAKQARCNTRLAELKKALRPHGVGGSEEGGDARTSDTEVLDIEKERIQLLQQIEERRREIESLNKRLQCSYVGSLLESDEHELAKATSGGPDCKQRVDLDARLDVLKNVMFRTKYADNAVLHDALDLDKDGVVSRDDMMAALTACTGEVWTRRHAAELLSALVHCRNPAMGATLEDFKALDDSAPALTLHSRLVALVSAPRTIHTARAKQRRLQKLQHRMQRIEKLFAERQRELMHAVAGVVRDMGSKSRGTCRNSTELAEQVARREELAARLAELEEEAKAQKARCTAEEDSEDVPLFLTPDEELLLRTEKCKHKQAEIATEVEALYSYNYIASPLPPHRKKKKKKSRGRSVSRNEQRSQTPARPSPPPARVQVVSLEQEEAEGEYDYDPDNNFWVMMLGTPREDGTTAYVLREVQVEEAEDGRDLCWVLQAAPTSRVVLQSVRFAGSDNNESLKRRLSTISWKGTPQTTVLCAHRHPAAPRGGFSRLQPPYSSAFRSCPTPAARGRDPLCQALNAAHKSHPAIPEDDTSYNPPQPPFSSTMPVCISMHSHS